MSRDIRGHFKDDGLGCFNGPLRIAGIVTDANIGARMWPAQGSLGILNILASLRVAGGCCAPQDPLGVKFYPKKQPFGHVRAKACAFRACGVGRPLGGIVLTDTMCVYVCMCVP